MEAVNIEDMSIDVLQNNVMRRNIVMNELRKAKRELKRIKEDELDSLAVDGNHLGANEFIRRKYMNILDDIEALLKVMDNGDWSLSVESTKEKEKLFPCWECGKVGCKEHK